MVQLPPVQLENQNDSIFSTGQYVALVLKPEKTMDTLSLVPLLSMCSASAVTAEPCGLNSECGQHPKGQEIQATSVVYLDR